MFTEMPI